MNNLNLMSKIIAVGIAFGLLISATSMFLGLMLYLVLKSVGIISDVSFLIYAAWFSLTAGVIVLVGWYLYLLLLARHYFLTLFTKKVKGKK